jgi:hypothetical protein
MIGPTDDPERCARERAVGTAHTAGAAVFSCDDPGVQTAAATGGGPHTFSCAGPTTVIVSGALAVFASVILDGVNLPAGELLEVWWAGSVEPAV